MQALFANCEYLDPVYGELLFPSNSDDRNESLEKTVRKLEVSNEILRKNLECIEKEHLELVKRFDLIKSELVCDVSELKRKKVSHHLEVQVAHNEMETIRNENEQLRVLSTGLSHQINFHMKDRHQGLNYNIRNKPIKALQDEPANDSFCVDEIDRCQKALSEVLVRIKQRNKVQNYSELVHGKSMKQSIKLTTITTIIKPVSGIASSTVEKSQIISAAFLKNSYKAIMTIINYFAKNSLVALVIFIVIIRIYLPV